MLWIILFVLLSVLFIFSGKWANKDEELIGLVVFIALAGIGAVFITGVTSQVALEEYSKMVGKKEGISMLESNVPLIKSCRYKDVISGTMVGGSLDNMQQSSKITDYMINLANRKAEYNSRIAELQYQRKSAWFFWIYNIWLIDKRIDTLEPIK